jgi:hypothetical protein
MATAAENPASTLPLHDIHLPAEVGWWPLAPGWWALFVLLLLSILAAWSLRRFWQRRRLRRLALRQLDALSGLPESELASALSRLLRRAAISHFPRKETAGLQGQHWLEFLDRPFDDHPFSTGVGRCLSDAPYRPTAEIDGPQVIALCRRWLKRLPAQKRSFWRGR